MHASHATWSPPPERLEVGSDEVHVWRAALDLPISQVGPLEKILADDERARAARFHFEQDRLRFLVARGLLRAILGRYLTVNPAALRFSYNPYGKPSLTREIGSDVSLCFNTTHSHGMALYAISRDRALGVDLERMRVDVAYASIAARFFSPAEVAALDDVPTYRRPEAFFRCWTRKEAYLKARGMGLSLDLSQFDVTVSPDGPAALLATREEGQDASRWSLYDLPAGEGYAAALAVEGTPHLRYWVW